MRRMSELTITVLHSRKVLCKQEGVLQGQALAALLGGLGFFVALGLWAKWDDKASRVPFVCPSQQYPCGPTSFKDFKSLYMLTVSLYSVRYIPDLVFEIGLPKLNWKIFS
jgi:hypothetical protein